MTVDGGAGPACQGTEALLRRIEVLEDRLLGALGPQAERVEQREQGVADRTDRAMEPRVAETMGPLVRTSLPAYLSITLTQAEEATVLRDVALQAGDRAAVREQEERAAGLTCVALTRAAEEFDVPQGVFHDAPLDQFLRGGEPFPGLDLDRFREYETHILRLAGLSNDLAVKHLDAAFTAYRDDRTLRIDTADDVRSALGRAADAACAVQTSLVREREKTESRRRRRANVRRCLLALGGATIAVANPLALPMIGPLAVAASAALGGGAAGAVANLIET